MRSSSDESFKIHTTTCPISIFAQKKRRKYVSEKEKKRERGKGGREEERKLRKLDANITAYFEI